MSLAVHTLQTKATGLVAVVFFIISLPKHIYKNIKYIQNNTFFSSVIDIHIFIKKVFYEDLIRMYCLVRHNFRTGLKKIKQHFPVKNINITY